VTTVLLVLVGEVGFGSRDESRKLLGVLAAHVLEGQNGGGLLVDDCAETSLALDDHIWDAHLTAKSGEEHDELNGVNIISDDNKVGLLRLDEGNGVVEAVLDEQGLLGLLVLGLLVSGSSVQTSLLLLLGLWAVLVQKLEELGRGVLVEGVRELGDCWGDLEALVENDLLPLKTDVFGPLDETSKVGLGADVLANTEVLGASLEERVLGDLARLTARERGGCGLLTGLGFGRLVIETTRGQREKRTATGG